LLCNALWSWLFFTWRRGGLAFADIVLLTGLIVATALAFASVRVLAAGLLLPYLAWVMFATALTLALWRANAAQLSK
jgi:tryptophan-rich sensory protein